MLEKALPESKVTFSRNKWGTRQAEVNIKKDKLQVFELKGEKLQKTLFVTYSQFYIVIWTNHIRLFLCKENAFKQYVSKNVKNLKEVSSFLDRLLNKMKLFQWKI